MNKLILQIILLFCTMGNGLSLILCGQDNFDDLFSDLIYDPNEPYLSGSAVVVSLEDGEIYTASQDVPAASDGSNGPNGANASTYWGDSTTTTQKFEEDNPTFPNDRPELDTTELSDEVGKLINPDDESGNGSAANSSEILNTKLDWFGLRFAKSNWTFHLQFGWIYIFEPSNKEEVWFYRPKQMGEFPSSWHWTSRENFPFVFNNSMGWLEFSGEEFYYLEKEFRSGLDSPRMDPQELVYNPFYFYDPGTTVMISLENGQLYTAKTEVPDSDDSRDEFYSPTGPNAGDYWNNFEQTINLFKDENPDFLNLFPTEINTEQRTIELAKIMGWQDEPEDEEDDFGGIFRELIYEPSKHYPAGVAVIEDLKDGEIYTSKIEVPAGKNSDDDTYSPNGPNSRKYWSSSYETVLSFENHNQNFLDQLPKSFVTDSISSEISELVAVRKNYLNIDSLFDGLIYDPHKTYHTGDSVVVSIEGGEIFTAKQKVPSEPNGRHSPNSLNGAKYWYSNSETVAAFEDEFDDFLEALPDSIHWEDLHHEVAKLTIPNDNTDSDKDGISDYLEMIEYKTNPDTDDSDEDGLPDSKEIEWGSDPTQSDQDMVDYLKELGKEEVFKDLQYHGLVSQEEYNEIQEQIELSNDANASPYTNDWFYLPERGWMWTDKSVYPYFFDSNSSGFLYFQAGTEKPRFYNFQNKRWFTID